jgi:hypothetical protein
MNGSGREKKAMMKKMLILVFFALSTAAIAQDFGPGGTIPGGRLDRSQDSSALVGGGGTTAVESASVNGIKTFALLGTGLVSLGIYAKRKQAKRI